MMDIAGTTVEDPDGVGGALKSALTAAGVDWTHPEVNAIMGIPKPLAIRTLLGESATDEKVDEIFRDFQNRMREYYRSDPNIRAMDGATDVFLALKAKGIKVGIDTGFDRSIVDVLFDRLGWGPDLIDVSVTSDEVANGRPAPDLIHKAMEMAGVWDSQMVAKVGDTPVDLQEGTAAGCRYVIGVTNGTHTREQLQPFPHTHLVDSIKDILTIVS